MTGNSDAVQDALMQLLEVKFEAFLARTELSSSTPEELRIMRSAFFVGVAAGIAITNTIRSNTDEA